MKSSMIVITITDLARITKKRTTTGESDKIQGEFGGPVRTGSGELDGNFTSG